MNVPGWPARQAETEEAWLLGQPPLTQYLDTIERAGAGEPCERSRLVAQWSAVNDVYIALQREEAGIANTAEPLPVPDALTDFLAEVRAHPFSRRSYNDLPVSFEMVELDKLMVYQLHVARAGVEAMMASLGPDPDLKRLARFCFPMDGECPAIEVKRLGRYRYQFRCPVPSFRAHQLKPLSPEALDRIESYGPVAACLALPIGLNANFLNAVRVGRRYLLHNGYHRACALRALGLTHAPCLVQTADRGEQVDLVVGRSLPNSPEFYFESARPPLLRDFFDPRLVRMIPLRREIRVVEITVDVDEYCTVA